VDLLSIAVSLWRHKIATLAVILLTGAGVAYVVVVQPSQYETTATMLLVPPPRAPTNEQVLADPSLKDVNTDNPYTRAYDPGIVINVVSTIVNSDTLRTQLVARGADSRYEVSQTARYGFSSPVAEVHATGASSLAARRTATLVIEAIRDELEMIQSSEDVDPRYFITTRLVDAPAPGVLQASGKLRGLIAVMGLGVLGLFTVVSTADAIARVRAERAAAREDDPPQPLDDDEPPDHEDDAGETPLATSVVPAPSIYDGFDLPPPVEASNSGEFPVFQRRRWHKKKRRGTGKRKSASTVFDWAAYGPDVSPVRSAAGSDPEQAVDEDVLRRLSQVDVSGAGAIGQSDLFAIDDLERWLEATIEEEPGRRIRE